MTIKLNRELAAKVTQAAAAGGYSSPQEFIEHVLEREVAREVAKVADDQPDEEVVRRLRGLGYID